MTNIDSVTKFQEYIDRAKEVGMTSLAFSEHGSVFKWFAKKKAIEQAGMKYIHACEVYVTETLEEKVRDNYHVVLIAKNYNGFLELNKLVSTAFNRQDNHFYYVPRISLQELFNTSENIMITTACIGGILNKGGEQLQERTISFLTKNKERCFLEIGHHLDNQQVKYNEKLWRISKETGVRLIAGTDTHALNERHVLGRKYLQLSKKIHFGEEDKWNLTFLTYDELCKAYEEQNVLPHAVYLEAIENTNVMADMVEPFEVDCSIKYPKLYDNPEKVFVEKIKSAKERHPYVNDRYTEKELSDRLNSEFKVYKATNSIDFMLLQSYLRDWEVANGIQCGYGRGSVSGSMIAYILGITQMDSMKFDLNFSRFMNPSRVTNADIDTDYGEVDRNRVKEFLLRDKLNLPNIQTGEIITFNTIALRGAIRDIGRALQMPLEEVNSLCEQCDEHDALQSIEKQYPELMELVHIVQGTIVSIGIHPGGVLVTDRDIGSIVGLCSTSTSDYPISMLDMIELDEMMFVKLDILGLANINVINETCKMLGIDRLTPDNVDLEDEAVWKSIRDDTTLIFQWESGSAQAYIRKFMSDATLEIAKEKVKNFSTLKWLSFGNGLIRPACASFRNSVANGEFYDNGLQELNDFLAAEAGHIAMQETIMKFLVEFCGYTEVESDNVRRAIAKKKGTDTLLPEIKGRFINYASKKYNIPKEKCEEVIEPFLQVILDASDYAFSWNHSDSYSVTGYICGYLRYYHPVEFLTAALNTFETDTDKTAAITAYAKKVGIKISPPRYGFSRNQYFYTKGEENVISKGIASVKYMSKTTADELYELSKYNYTHFSDLLVDIKFKTSINGRQIEYLIKIDFFNQFGNQQELLNIAEMVALFKYGKAKTLKREVIDMTVFEEPVRANSTCVTKAGNPSKSYTFKDLVAIMRACEDIIKSQGLADLDISEKFKNFEEIMGYTGYISGLEEDRSKLYIKNVYPAKRKKDGKIFGYRLETVSIGSGKQSHMTVFKNVYDKDPIHKKDIIRCLGWKRDGQYFQMTSYRKVCGIGVKQKRGLVWQK